MTRIDLWYSSPKLDTKLSQSVQNTQVVQFIEKTMETWRVELTAGEKSLAEANSREMNNHHNYL